MNERSIERFPMYSFMADGSVVSHSRRKPFIMSPIRMGSYVGLQLKGVDGQIHKEYLHRLICEAFNGPCPADHVCRHLDGDKTNNKAANLAWGTQTQNNMDKLEHGTAPNGEKNPMAKLRASEVMEMREIRRATGSPFHAIAKKFNVSPMTAYRAITGQCWGTL